MYTVIVLEGAKMAPWLSDASFLNHLPVLFGFEVARIIGANKIYPRHFCSDENVYSNCLGRAKNGSLGLGDVFLSNIGLF